MERKREANIELLRIIAMAFIVFGHVSGAFYIPQGNPSIIERIIVDLSRIGVCAVDVFVLISGYFLITKTDYRIRQILHLLFQTIFYCFTITFVFFLFHKASLYDCFLSLDPLLPSRFNYWFVTKYIGLILLQPFLSRFALSLNKKQYRLFLIILLILTTNLTMIFPLGNLFCDGWSLWWFISLFFIGGYLRLYYCSGAYITLPWIAIFSISSVLFMILRKVSFIDCSYNSIITLLLSISVFCIFKNFVLQENRIISLVAPNVFVVYLIHSHHFYLPFFYTLFSNYTAVDYNSIWFSVLFSFATFAFSIIIALLLKYIMSKSSLYSIEFAISQYVNELIKDK